MKWSEKVEGNTPTKKIIILLYPFYFFLPFVLCLRDWNYLNRNHNRTLNEQLVADK